MTHSDPRFPDFTGLILDGGRATRMAGAHKAFLDVGGRPIAERTVALFRALFADVIAASDKPEAWSRLGIRCVTDPLPNCGPLGGIAAGLLECRTPFAFVAAGDMPELSEAVVSWLCERALASSRDGGGQPRAVLPRRDGRAEPLHAVWPASLGVALRAALHRGVRKPTEFLDGVAVTWVEASELEGLPGADRTFRNVNEPRDVVPP